MPIFVSTVILPPASIGVMPTKPLVNFGDNCSYVIATSPGVRECDVEKGNTTRIAYIPWGKAQVVFTKLPEPMCWNISLMVDPRGPLTQVYIQMIADADLDLKLSDAETGEVGGMLILFIS